MLGRIWHELNYYTDVQHDEIDDISQLVLKVVEEAGMLPPYTPHKKEGHGIEITLNAWDTE